MICVYHGGGCQDGFASAYAVWAKYGANVRFIPAIHDKPLDIPIEDDEAIIFADFCPRPQDLLEFLTRHPHNKVTVFDHHKSSQERLESSRFYESAPSSFRAVFDMNRSGCGITWEELHHNQPPLLLQHVQDRDLWQFRMPGTKDVCAGLFSYQYDFNVWDMLVAGDVDACDRLAADGLAITRKEQQDLIAMLPLVTRSMKIDGHEVYVANVPYTMASVVGNRLAQGRPFAATYFDDNDGKRRFSLRSDDNGLDVSQIAAKYGGGGHAHSAGFVAPTGWDGE